MIIYIQLTYIAFCVILAWVNYLVIKADLRVYHGINAALHVAFWCFSILFYEHWIMFVVLPLLGRVVFDTALNLFRSLPIDYVSPWVKAGNPRASKIDRLEWAVFHDGLKPKVCYLAAVVIINLLIIFL